MTQFLDHELYSTYNWPQDMIDEFNPIIVKCRYNKGSLQQTVLKSILVEDFNAIPIPPVYEDGLWKDEHRRVLEVARVFYFLCQVMLLHKLSMQLRLKIMLLDLHHQNSLNHLYF